MIARVKDENRFLNLRVDVRPEDFPEGLVTVWQSDDDRDRGLTVQFHFLIHVAFVRRDWFIVQWMQDFLPDTRWEE